MATWKIENIYRNPETGVVYEVDWSISGANGTRTFDMGFAKDELDALTDYTPFEELTEAQVIQWVKDMQGAEMVAFLEQDIDAVQSESQQAQETPVTLSEGKPW